MYTTISELVADWHDWGFADRHQSSPEWIAYLREWHTEVTGYVYPMPVA